MNVRKIWHVGGDEYVDAVRKSEYDDCNLYALRLVVWLATRFPAVEKWEPLPDLMGKLGQIDNMVCRLHQGFGANPTSGADHG